jgi:hypothetical protein
MDMLKLKIATDIVLKLEKLKILHVMTINTKIKRKMNASNATNLVKPVKDQPPLTVLLVTKLET